MAGPADPRLRRRGTGAAARGRNPALEARLSHPVFEALRPWLGLRSLRLLNEAAAKGGVRTENGREVRFVPPTKARRGYGAYELRAFDTGEIETRADSLHDWFNALAWLAFPRTKARLNALHAAAIPGERGRRSRLRDLLTIFDEGGAIVLCDDEALLELLRAHQWRRLFLDHRGEVAARMRFVVLGHAVLEQALDPWPGITCKAILAPRQADPDAAAAAWLAALAPGATPRELAPLPVFGYPGWWPGQDAAFYADDRYFRLRETPGSALPGR